MLATWSSRVQADGAGAVLNGSAHGAAARRVAARGCVGGGSLGAVSV